ncbi:MAG: ERF family protein [Phaeodactylibacter sp.]|nr:ERF family protein [Phaeodactylibacter sp.]
MSTKSEDNVSVLSAIQTELVVLKTHEGHAGRYVYRKAEDILAAAKPLIKKYGCFITITDDITAIGDRVYVKATATLTDSGGVQYSTNAFAREAKSKNGMDDAQVTGAASSYARKYALCGLFAIDNTDNPDADDEAHTSQGTSAKIKVVVGDENFEKCLNGMKGYTPDKKYYTIEELRKWFVIGDDVQDALISEMAKHQATA